MSFSCVHIGGPAASYVRAETEFGRALAQVVRGIDFESGHFSAFVPDRDGMLVHAFADGALRDGDEEARAVRCVADLLIKDLGLGVEPGTVLLCEFADGATQPPPSAQSRGADDGAFPTVWITGAKESYQNGELWFAGQGVDEEFVTKMLEQTLWFPAVAVLIRNVTDASLRHGQTIPYSALRNLAQAPSLVLCGAWDAMNYLLWTPSARAGLEDPSVRP